jgi:uncharacterized protein YecE (DUF72 family)
MHTGSRLDSLPAEPEPKTRLAGAKLASASPARRAMRDVFCYFDNDAKVHAPFDAASLAERPGAAQRE